MGQFLIRPEINNANNGDYELLHQEMYNRKIYRVILSDKNIWHDLPTGTYSCDLDLSLEEVFSLATAALNAIGKTNSGIHRSYELIVTGRLGSSWDLRRNTDKTKLP